MLGKIKSKIRAAREKAKELIAKHKGNRNAFGIGVAVGLLIGLLVG